MNDNVFAAKVQKKYPYAYTLLPKYMWQWVYRNLVIQPSPSRTDLTLFLEQWCKETKRGGGVLVGSSIKELLLAYHKHTNTTR